MSHPRERFGVQIKSLWGQELRLSQDRKSKLTSQNWGGNKVWLKTESQKFHRSLFIICKTSSEEIGLNGYFVLENVLDFVVQNGQIRNLSVRTLGPCNFGTTRQKCDRFCMRVRFTRKINVRAKYCSSVNYSLSERELEPSLKRWWAPRVQAPLETSATKLECNT